MSSSNNISAYCYLSMCVCDADLKNKIYDTVNSIVVDFASTISGDTEKAIMSPMY